jgi:hypothetical protein
MMTSKAQSYGDEEVAFLLLIEVGDNGLAQIFARPGEHQLLEGVPGGPRGTPFSQLAEELPIDPVETR